jgi:hypothetical protein
MPLNFLVAQKMVWASVVFNAITAPMHAEFENKNGEKFSMETEPLTNYNVFVLDQSLKNHSFITFTNTDVIRNSHARDA